MIKKSGFTIIEALVVVSVIAILIALLTPAVIEAKKAAEKAQVKTQEPQRFESKSFRLDGYNILLITDKETDAEYLSVNGQSLTRIK